ncbi:glutaminyl-peptide cyclotransferase-like isoform X2 [Anthonomus grandis grandis]|uniref:glutaminyl-peptide cyclotransferase-like isoform X2 n=1 Tax=Anthonomus grandis grandis TaxID=2921223 RepID=UPI0021656361|nr:glutaminyl-peptide cyclotransferase-like isoform X2 [Anthonomus grandis grandis]
MLSIFLKSIILISAFGIGTANQLRKIQRTHTPQRLTNGDIKQLAALSNVTHLNQAIDNILIPRVVGTKNHEKVFKYISSELENLGWDVEVDEFQEDTPNFGRLTFKNIIGSLNPDADRFLVLACHYDSKYFANQVFVGAIDSAVPCAMLLNLAKVLKPHLDSIKSNDNLSLKLVFFDGEEAFESWGPKDSIYGARHLAGEMHKKRGLTRTTGEQVSDLQKIDMLVLLDLIGHRNVNFFNYFADTSGWFSRLAGAEDRLEKLRLLNPRDTKYFIRRDFFTGNIEDDHLPFLRRNVPILHLIPIPFPKEWHTPNDDRNIIDIKTVENLNMILRIFLAEYLHLDTSEDIPEKEL